MKRPVLLRHGESAWNRENRAGTGRKPDAAGYVVGNTRHAAMSDMRLPREGIPGTE